MAPPAAMQLPLELELRSSRLIAAYLLCIHAAALASLVPLSLPSWLKIGAVIPLSWSALYGLRRHAWRTAAAAIAGVRLHADGSIELLRRGGAVEAAAVEPASTLLPFAIVIRVRYAERRGGCAVVVAPDALSAEQLRQLRVWLRWLAGGDQAPKL